MIVKADKSKSILIINENTLEKKIDNFIHQKNIMKLNKDPTETLKKQIQKGLRKCNTIVDKRSHSKYKTYSLKTEHIHKYTSKTMNQLDP